ncbi:acetylxylan esterase [Paenibacillus antri]|uniref:Acetylxylan esterase n=1 Tax=Paenibacillus antri TaxID=2582848 RepID=A0A5R9G682_9BACL|nr:acetylxylan esterase [Paenibacillus antri]TLS48273.1 acetylxylan esterase [Paenibacillus antri]
MNAIEKRIDELHRFRPVTEPPEGHAEFWERTTKEAIGSAFEHERVEIETPMPGMKAYDVAFEGFSGTTIRGLYMVPAFIEGPYPCILTFPGYTGGKGLPEAYARWILMGVAVFAVDVRGQGGETGNTLDSEFGMVRGWITQNITDPERCYYKAVTVDCLRAAQWMSEQPELDPKRLGVVGGSQGGGLALLVSALHERIGLTVADIPNMCHMDHGVLHSTGSLTEVADFGRRYPELLPQALRTLGYFDLLHLGHRITRPLLMSVGLKDTVCLPEQVFPMYHAAASEDKALEIFPFTGHAVEAAQTRRGMEFVRDRWFR